MISNFFEQNCLTYKNKSEATKYEIRKYLKNSLAVQLSLKACTCDLPAVTWKLLAVVASQICEVAQNSEQIWIYSSSRSFKVEDFGTNRKRIFDFLLVIKSNLGPILHRFWDTATYTYWLKIAYFSYPLLFGAPAPLPMFPLESRGEVNHEETRVVATLWWKLHDPNFNRFWLIHPCDGQTDGQTGDSI